MFAKRLVLCLALLLGAASIGEAAIGQTVGYVQINPQNAPQPGGFNTQTGTVASFKDTSLPANQCVQTGVDGLFTTTGSNCGGGGSGGGASSLGINFNGVSITSPTAQINFVGGPVNVTAIGSTATVTFSQISLSTAVTGSLPASRIASGALGSGVIASSISVNGVYPSAVSAGIYSNITLPAANVASGSLGASVIASSVAVGTIGVPQMGFSGTASSSTFARGDGAWSSVPSGASGIVSPGTFTWTNPNGINVSTISALGATIGNENLELTNAANARFDDTGSNRVSIQAPPVLSSSYGLVWPTGQGASSTFLQNDGIGNLSWAIGSGGGGSPIGTINLASQYSAPYYSVTGSSNVLSGSSVSIYPSSMTAGSASSVTLGNHPYAVFSASGTSQAIQVNVNGTPSGGAQNQIGAVTINGPTNATDGNNSPALLVLADSTTNSTNGAGLLELWENAPAHNSYLLWIHGSSTRNSDEPIRFDGPTWGIDEVNTSTDNAHGLGKWKVISSPYQGTILQLASPRAWDNTTFENLAYATPFTQPSIQAAGIWLKPQTLTNDSAVLTSTDTSVYGWETQNGHTVGLTSPLNPSASWTFALPSTFNNQGQVLYQSDNGRGNNNNARSWAFTTGGTTGNVLTYNSGGAPTWSSIASGGLPLPGGATNYWNYPSSGTFVDTQGISVSSITASSDVIVGQGASLTMDYPSFSVGSRSQIKWTNFGGSPAGSVGINDTIPVGFKINASTGNPIAQTIETDNIGTTRKGFAVRAGGAMRFYDSVNDATNHFVSLQASGTVSANHEYILPSIGQAEGQILTVHADSSTYWSTPSAGGSGGYAVQPATVAFNLAQGVSGSTMNFTAFNTTTSSVSVTGANGLWVNNGISGSTMTLINASSPFTLSISTSSTGINQLTVSSAIATKTSDFLLNVSSSNGVLNFGVQNDGHIISSGTIPGVSSCGTSPTMDPSSTDSAGKINVGSVTATACTLTFANAYASAPICTVSDDSTGVTADISSISSTSVTFGFSISLAGGHVWYLCFGGRGG